MFFLTQQDPNFRIKGSRDPLGFQTIWQSLGRNVIKYFDKKILKLNNLNIVDLDHNKLEFLQLNGLLDKELIKPLYLS